MSEAQLRGLFATLVASAPVGFGLFDTDLRFVVVNEALAEMNGAAPEAHVGRTIAEIVPNIADEAIVAFESVLETGVPLLGLEIGGETPASPGVSRSWSESVYRVEVDGLVIGVAAVVVETTERRRAEQRIRRIIDSLGSFVGLLDLGGVVLEANDFALRAAGISTDDVLGRPFWETYWWSHDPRLQHRLKDAIDQAANGRAVRFDARVRVAGDKLITIDFQLIPMFEDGELTGLVPSGVDVTEQRSAALRVRALGEFAQALAVADRTDDVAAAVLSHLPDALDAQFANLALVDPDRVAVDFLHPPSLPDDIRHRFARSTISSSTPLTDAVRTNQVVIVNDLEDYRARYPALVADTISSGLVATTSVPLEAEGRVLQ